MLSPEIWTAVRLTVELAALTTIILIIVGTPVAWWLARSRARWKEAVAAVVALPLVLPPTVLGFYLLVTLGPSGPGGALAGLWGARTMAFTFEGLVIGSVVYSLPFVVQPIRNAFEAFGDRPLEVAATLRASPWRAFWTVAVPLARPGFLTGAVLLFREARSADEDESEAEEEYASRATAQGFRVIATSFVVLFAAEWGDLSQLLTISLVAKYDDPFSVFLGAWGALLAVSGLAVIVGRLLLQRVRLSVLHYVGATVCLFMAALTVWEMTR